MAGKVVRVGPGRTRKGTPRRGHSRHLKDQPTFAKKVQVLREASPDMPEKMARGIVSKWMDRHEPGWRQVRGSG